MFYSFCISSFGWEFGIEAFMERPSYQDLVITPVVGSVIGELFYKTKRKIVENNYHLAGSKFLGNVVVFLIDPVNEVIDLFRGNPCRKMHFPEDGEDGFVDNGSHVVSSLMPCMVGGAPGFRSLFHSDYPRIQDFACRPSFANIYICFGFCVFKILHCSE